jgi:murein DD-endopeptidase MepM/ murein hydrolase activator NlpD
LKSFFRLGFPGYILVSLLFSACAAGVTKPPVAPSPVPRASAALPAATKPALTHAATVKPTRSLPCSPEYCIQPGVFPLSRPILLPGNNRVEGNYRYGYTQGGTREPHHGMEFTNPVGTSVRAAADGTVLYAGTDSNQVFGLYPNFYGNLVILEHSLPGFNTPVYTLYGHLSQITVKTGDRVSRGDLIGAVGLTGSAIGAHLHFEVRLGEPAYDHTANPELFIPPLPAADTGVPTGILIGRIEGQNGTALHIPITIQPLNEDGTLEPSTFPELYGAAVPSHPQWNENFLVPDLPAGKYRVAFVDYSKVFEQTVEIIPGDITFVKITANP